MVAAGGAVSETPSIWEHKLKFSTAMSVSMVENCSSSVKACKVELEPMAEREESAVLSFCKSPSECMNVHNEWAK